MITYENICRKLGFAFDNEKNYRPDIPSFEDDSVINPYSVLNEEELDFIGDYLRNKPKLRTA
ncbi:MAG: hypothetical protein LBM87_04440 [Ruminococcus sp.]|jgi:hypothetical protein|nr:hypothetical protein [Ruminococcus sp.]